MHVGNAFESEAGSTLTIDLGVFEGPSILNDLKMAALRQGPPSEAVDSAGEGGGGGEGGVGGGAAARCKGDITGCQYMRLSLPLQEADPDSADGSSSLPVSLLWA